MRNFTLKLILLYFTLLSVFCICSYISQSIHQDRLRQNILQSASTLEDEGYYPLVIPFNPCSRLDNFTDSWMIGMCYSDTSYTPLENVFFSSYYYVNIDYPENENTERIDALTLIGNNNLNKACTGRYGRYWHGYIFSLKTLLLFFNYPQIRVINYVALGLIASFAFWLVYKKKPHICFWGLAVTMLIGGIILVPLSLQFSSCYYIMFSSIIAMLLSPSLTNKTENGFLTFFTIGAVTSYFDLLTTPLITLCIPGAIILYRANESIRKSVLWTIAWFSGYGILWGSKWLLSYIITDISPWSEIFSQICLRTTGAVAPVSILRDSYFMGGMLVLLTICLLWLSYRYCIVKNRISDLKNSYYLLVFASIAPLWMIALHNHTTIHIFFTWRNMLIPFICYILFIWTIFFSYESRDTDTVL